MSIELEKLMEEKKLPESDRDELRIFSSFLSRRKDARSGVGVKPLTENEKIWLGLNEPQGEDR